MPQFVSVLLISVSAVWLVLDRFVQRKLRSLKAELPAAYRSAIATKPEDGPPAIIPLAIDLMRKKHSTVPLTDLSPPELRIALHALALDRMPRWMLRLAAVRLPRQERAILRQLRGIKTSRPIHPEVHFGAIHAQQRLRSTSKV